MTSSAAKLPLDASNAEGEASGSGAVMKVVAGVSAAVAAVSLYRQHGMQYAPWTLVPRGSVKMDVPTMIHGAKLALKSEPESVRLELATQVESIWDPSGSTICTFSVRSSFHLLLTALNLPEGTEILVSAVTISDMVKIILGHKLVPVPVDLNVDTMEPILPLAEQLVSPKTRIFLCAPLFGTRTDTSAVAQFCRRHNLLFVQDLAQAFDGVEYKGDPQADIVMLSFGTIKTATALGGALMTVRDAALRQRLRELQATWPVQSALGHYLPKCAFYIVSRPFTVDPDAAGLLDAACRMCGSSFDEILTRWSRSFPGDQLFAQIERQPCAALLKMFVKRLCEFDMREIRARQAQGIFMRSLLPAGVVVPGQHAAYHNYWVFPVMVKEHAAVRAALRAVGIDATASASQLYVVPVPEQMKAEQPERAQLASPVNARFMYEHLLYLPGYFPVPLWAIYRTADALKKVCTEPLPPFPRPAPPTARL